MIWKSRYMRLLESQVEQLKLELAAATLERQAAVNSLLAHIGAPTMSLGPVERKAIPEQRKRELPSVARRMKEAFSRNYVNKEQATQ